MTLPQFINGQAEEPNLQCLFQILREFDYQRTSTPLPKIAHLFNHINPGVDRIIDLNTLLLQYYDLQDIDDKETSIKFTPRQRITECKLSLDAAMARCRSAYSGMECEQVEYGEGDFNKAPFVSPKCPPGYQRYGCCTCLRKCNYGESIYADKEMHEDPTMKSPWTNTNYCLKKETINSVVKKGAEKQMVGVDLTQFEILEETPGGYVFVQQCPTDFKRVGARQCFALCPLGWPDMGRKCLKRGELIYFPFVWQPGDGKVEAKVVDESGNSSSSSSKTAKKASKD